MIKYPEDYNPILEYWDDIKTGKVTVSKKVYKVYKEIVNNIINNSASEWEYNPKKANHCIEFIENFCKHSKGAVGGKPFILETWQKALVGALFGIVHKIDETRKYRELLFIVARKNGKSALSSAIALYMLFADGEAGATIVSVATKREQAKLVWQESKSMVKKSPALSKRARCLVGEIITDFNDGSFKPLSSESNTLDGLNISCACIDELHAIRDKNLYDVIVDGMSARTEPVTLITTTAGTVRECIFDLKYEEAERIINGYGDPNGYHDERVLPIIYELDSRDEWIDPNAWKKANPALGTIKSIDQLANKVEKAKANPILVRNLLTKDFNVRSGDSEAWLEFEQLNNTTTFDIDVIKPRYGICGIDLSETTDLTACSLMFKIPNDEHFYFETMYWLPEDLLEKRVKEDKIPYDLWRDQGWLRTSAGNKINYHDITDWLLEMQQKHDVYIYKIGYDAWSATYLIQELNDTFGNDVCEAVHQGMKTLSSPMKTIGADFDAKRIVYNNNPITKWCLSNVSYKEDINGNIQPCKTSNQRKRIDGFASMLDAYVAYERNKEEYESII